MTTGATGQLGLALPVQGELSGTWGDTVNNGTTQYTNIAIAATLTLTNDGAVTLANTTGDASASNIVSTLTGAGTVTAQFAIVRVTGTLTTAKVVTAPSYSKTYTVVNAATGGIVTFKASGQTGVSIAVGESAFVYYNGTDYVKVSSTVATGVTSFTAGTTGFTPNTATTGAVTLAGTLATANGGTNLTSFTSGGVVYASSSSALATGSVFTFDGANNLALTGTNNTQFITTTTSTTTGAYAGYKASSDATLQMGQFSASNAGTSFGLSNANLAFIYTTSYASVHPSALAIGSFGTTPIVFATNGAEAMRINTSQNVGIGTSSPAEKLEVVAGTGNVGTATFRTGDATAANNAGGGFRATSSATAGSRNSRMWLDADGADFAGSDYFYITKVGNGGIVELIQQSSAAMTFQTSGTERARISAAGGFSVGTTADPGAGAIYATGNITAYYSDARLKTVSGKIENALDKVAKLSGVYYTNNDTAKSFGYDSNEVQVGVLAQDVEAVLPQIVKAAPFDLDEHGNSKSGENYKTVQYERLVPLLIEAINELRAEVKALKGA